MNVSVEGELRSLLIYFGEKPDSSDAPKPEDFFGLISSFATSLQVSDDNGFKFYGAEYFTPEMFIGGPLC